MIDILINKSINVLAHNSRSTVIEFTLGQILSQRKAETLIQRKCKQLDENAK